MREVWDLPEAVTKSFVHIFYSTNEATNDSGSEKSYFAQTLKLACFRRLRFSSVGGWVLVVGFIVFTFFMHPFYVF